MKWASAALALVASIVCPFHNHSAAEEYGPPGPMGGRGAVSFAIGYSHYSGTWESGLQDESFPESELKLPFLYFYLGYSFLKGWEAYGRVSTGRLEEEDAFPYDVPLAMESDRELSGAIGARGLVYRTSEFGVGPFVQAVLLPSYKETKPGLFRGGPILGAMEYSDPWIINFGLGLQRIAGPAVLYGGPFVYLTGGDRTYTSTYLGLDREVSTNVEEGGNLGAYYGVRIPLAGFELGFEGQSKSKTSFGFMVGRSFGLMGDGD